MLYRTNGWAGKREKESLTGEGDGNDAKNVADVMVQNAGGLEPRKDRRTIEKKVGKGTLARPGKKGRRNGRQTAKGKCRRWLLACCLLLVAGDGRLDKQQAQPANPLPSPNSATRLGPPSTCLLLDAEAVRRRGSRMSCYTALVPPPPVVRPAQRSDDIHVSRALQPTGDTVSPNALPVGRWLL